MACTCPAHGPCKHLQAVREARKPGTVPAHELRPAKEQPDNSKTCPVCDGSGWMYYDGGRTTCDGCAGDGRNHYPLES